MGVKISKNLPYFFKTKSKLCIRFVLNCSTTVVHVCLKKDNCNWLSFYTLSVRTASLLLDYKYTTLRIVIKILLFLLNGIKKLRYTCKHKLFLKSYSFATNTIIVEHIYMYQTVKKQTSKVIYFVDLFCPVLV